MKFKVWLTSLMVALFSFSTAALEIGYIDMAVLVPNLKQIQQFNESMTDKQAQYQKLYQKKQDEIAVATEKQKSREDIQKMMEKAEEELLPKQQELMNLQRAFETNLKLQIDTTSKKIAEEYNLEVVVNKEVLFFGGFDITNLVLEELNK